MGQRVLDDDMGRCDSAKSEQSLVCDVTEIRSPSSKSMSHDLRALVGLNSLYRAVVERSSPSEFVFPSWKVKG